MNIDKAKQLACEHWAYIKQLLLTHGVPIEQVNIIGFHYKSAFVHGYKHGQEDKDSIKRSYLRGGYES